MLPMPEAGDLAELLLLYYNYRYTPAVLVDSVSVSQLLRHKSGGYLTHEDAFIFSG